ncbi:hypothetical protein [Thiofilum flexile]|uniref:hypothetical protein n=1 Tax=Thiofilum flexile TaxID=125627 RepID=UPI00037903DA|nr:hypothetical protein [Thiofilum flexile]
MTHWHENTKLDRPTEIIHTKSLRDIVEDLNKARSWLLIAAVAAFLASAFFVVKYFVGGSMQPETWTMEQWLNAALGLGITAVITAAQAFLYASGYKGAAAIIATFIVVFFGLFSEISQSMEREDFTVRHRSENSEVFKATVQSIGQVSAQLNSVTPQQQAYATAQSQLRYWQDLKAQKMANHSAVKYSHATLDRYIAEYQRQAVALQSQVQLADNSRTALLSSAVQQAKALEYDEDKHYAIIRLIKEGFGVTAIWASFIFSFIIIGTFEYAFHFVGNFVANHKKALWLLKRDSTGALIETAAQTAASQTEIPRDFGNTLRDEYLDYVTPERKQRLDELAQERAATMQSAHAEEANNIAHQTAAESVAKVTDITQERFFKVLYAEVRDRIEHGEVRPTVRPVTDIVTEVVRHQASLLGLKPSALGKPQRQAMAEQMLLRLEKDGVLVPNEEGGVGKAKYVLAPKYQQKLQAAELQTAS